MKNSSAKFSIETSIKDLIEAIHEDNIAKEGLLSDILHDVIIFGTLKLLDISSLLQVYDRLFDNVCENNPDVPTALFDDIKHLHGISTQLLSQLQEEYSMVREALEEVKPRFLEELEA